MSQLMRSAIVAALWLWSCAVVRQTTAEHES